MKKTLVMLEVHHEKDIPNLSDLIAIRTYTIDGVRNTNAWVQGKDTRETFDGLRKAGFTVEEIALGSQEVVRG